MVTKNAKKGFLKIKDQKGHPLENFLQRKGIRGPTWLEDGDPEPLPSLLLNKFRESPRKPKNWPDLNRVENL